MRTAKVLQHFSREVSDGQIRFDLQSKNGALYAQAIVCGKLGPRWAIALDYSMSCNPDPAEIIREIRDLLVGEPATDSLQYQAGVLAGRELMQRDFLKALAAIK